MQARDLVATEDIELFVDDRQAEGVEDAGGVAVPSDLAQLIIGHLADPDVATPGGEGDASVLEEGEGADAHPRLIRVVFGDGDVVDEVGGVQNFREFVLQGGLLVRVGGLCELFLDGVGLLGLVDFAEDAFGDDILLPLRLTALGEGAEVDGLGAAGGGLGEGSDVLAPVGEGDLETGARSDLAELEHEDISVGGQYAVDALDGDFGREFIARLALGKRERSVEAVGLHAAAIGEVSEADGFVEFARDDGEAAADYFNAADGFELSAFEEAGAADSVGESNTIAGEVEADILGVFAWERAERNRRHDFLWAGGKLARLSKAAVLAPARTRIGLGEEVGTFSGGWVRAVGTIEGNALTLEPAAGPKASATEGFSVEGVTGIFGAKVHEHGLIGRTAFLFKGALALGVVDGGAQEATVVHLHVFAGRLSGGLLWGIGLFRGVCGRGRKGRKRESGQGHEGTCMGEHRGVRGGVPGGLTGLNLTLRAVDGIYESK